MFFDTDREREIDLGTRYEEAAMNEAECLINQDMATQLDMSTGDYLFMKIDM